MKSRSLPFLLAGLCLGGVAAAQPSGGFYWFKDKFSGQVMCAQHAMSPDWVQLPGGPFQDQECTVPEAPKTERKDLPAVPPGLAPKK